MKKTIAIFILVLFVGILIAPALPALAQEETITPTVTLTETPTPLYNFDRTITLGDYQIVNAIVIVGAILLASILAIILLVIINPRRGGNS